jgi:hypothetical protein
MFSVHFTFTEIAMARSDRRIATGSFQNDDSDDSDDFKGTQQVASPFDAQLLMLLCR